MIYQFVHGGLPQELMFLDSKEAIKHLRNYLGNFLLDPVTSKVYLARFLREEKIDDETGFWIQYLINKCCELDPINIQLRELRQQLTGKNDPHLELLKIYSSPPAIRDKISDLDHLSFDKQRRVIWSLLKDHPYWVDLIWKAYMLDFYQNLPVASDWSKLVKIPSELTRTFEELAMQLCFLQEDIERAYFYYEKTKIYKNHSCQWLNCAAEIANIIGDKTSALNYYEKSLKCDPNQKPIVFRIKEIASPLKTYPHIINEVSTGIFIYSYNKCDKLETTLLSLANSELGRAHIAILLNGCSDNSYEMVQNINEKYFRNSIQIISLPVNIGAQAARNWLINTEIGKTSDFVAFLDDDVVVQPDWLITLLSAIRNYPKAGVIGSKVVFPGKPKRLQYLYRNISVAKENLIRLSLDTPNFNYDYKTYDFVRPTTTVMGCCHLLTRKALDSEVYFDIRFSPSQMDDIAHDLDLRIKGFDVIYCGLVECIHHQTSGIGNDRVIDLNKYGNVLGNDVKFFYRFYPYLEFLKKENNLDSHFLS